MTAEYADFRNCAIRPYRDRANRCDRCGERLPERRTRWCSDVCRMADFRQHHWRSARKLALERDGYKCVTCGSTENLEVNHITPRVGKGYNVGCWNHVDNLETLCRPCHTGVTKRQRAERLVISA